jgi:hypothetical protein
MSALRKIGLPLWVRKPTLVTPLSVFTLASDEVRRTTIGVTFDVLSSKHHARRRSLSERSTKRSGVKSEVLRTEYLELRTNTT